MNGDSSPSDVSPAEEMSKYDYCDAYEIATTPEQDRIIAEEFSKIAEEDYNLITNNCAHAVQRSMAAGKVNFDKKIALMPTAHVIAGAVVSLPSIKNEYNVFNVWPLKAYNMIIKNNPNGKRYTKN